MAYIISACSLKMKHVTSVLLAPAEVPAEKRGNVNGSGEDDFALWCLTETL